MKLAINITIPFSFNEKHYQGIAIHSGVNLSLDENACRTVIKLDNTKTAYPTGLFWDCVSALDDKSKACPDYLQIKPKV